MSFFRKMLAPKEVKQALAALVLAETEFGYLEHYALVKQRVEQIILSEQKRVIHSIVVDEVKPMNLVFLLITNVTGDYLILQRYFSSRFSGG